MTKTTMTFIAAAVLGLAACSKKGSEPAGSNEVSAGKTTEATPSSAAPDADCPIAVTGTKVDVADTETGVALTFTTDNGDVDQLRQRVAHMAQMYATYGGHGHMMWHQMGYAGMGQGHMMGGPGMGSGYMHGAGPMPAAAAKTENVEKGARIVLTPTDTSQLAALREGARLHRQRMNSGECWVLQSTSSDK